MDRSLWPKMAEVSNGAFFCTTELSTQGKMKWSLIKHSFLRELREVAPEMELFPENHSPYEKDFVTKSNPYAKFSARHFTKNFVS